MAKVLEHAIGRRILEVIQEEARIPNVELAGRVGLSLSPRWRRMRALGDAEVVRRYVTLVDAEAIGLPINDRRKCEPRECARR